MIKVHRDDALSKKKFNAEAQRHKERKSTFAPLRLCVESSLFFLVLCSCEQEGHPQASHNRPYLPAPIGTEKALLSLPLLRDSPEARQHFSDVLDHPWVRSQPNVSLVSQGMVEDIRSLERGYALLNAKRKEQDLPTPSFEEESDMLTRQLQRLQNKLSDLHLHFSPELYNVLNIPESSPSQYHTPIPFQVHKRVYLGQSKWNFPLYLDVRVFSFAPQESQPKQQQHIAEIISWHKKLLQGEDEAFLQYSGENCLVLVGHGDRNLSHFDNSHGLAVKNRGIFAAFLPREHRLYVLYADTPWEDFEKLQNTFFHIIKAEGRRMKAE